MSIAIMNLQRITPFAISAFLLTLVPETSAATWFVAPDGTGDGSAGNPWGDIKTAVASNSPVKAGDTIVVRAGTYSLSSAVDLVADRFCRRPAMVGVVPTDLAGAAMGK